MSANTASAYSDNIVTFPVRHRNPQKLATQDPGEILSNLYDMKIMSIEQSLSFILPLLFESIVTAGYKTDNDQLNSVLVATIRAIMYEHFGFEHPLAVFFDKHGDELEIALSDQLDITDLDDEFDSDC